MANGTICLSFDFDAVSLWMSRQITSGTPVSRGEFGVTAIPRILKVLSSRELAATFFIPGHTIASFPEACESIAAAGHEVALHGWAHENVTLLEESTERGILQRSRAAVIKLTGSAPTGYRSPAWDVSPNTLSLLAEAGIVYDSSLMSDDYSPFRPRTGDIVADDAMQFGNRSNLVELPISWTVDDYPQFEYLRMPGLLMPGLRKPGDVFSNWSDDVRYMLRDFDRGVLTATFHPQVIGRGHRLLGLERWLDELIEMGVEFRRMDSVAAEFLDNGSFGVWKPGQES